MVVSNVKYVLMDLQNMQMNLNHVLCPTVLSTEAARMSI